MAFMPSCHYSPVSFSSPPSAPLMVDDQLDAASPFDKVTPHVHAVPHMEPQQTFVEMKLSEILQQNLQRCRYTQPTPVQRYAIPAILSGVDLMACAQTGSGKTAAFLLPVMELCLRQQQEEEQQQHGQFFPSGRGGVALPFVLILAPTRELSLQIHDEARKFLSGTSLRVVAVYGGASLVEQARQLSFGVSFLVATPGRLLDFVQRQQVSLMACRHIILDEADRMLDMGFEPQIRQLFNAPISGVPPVLHRQTILCSATFPREIQNLAREFLRPAFQFLSMGRVGSTTENIVQEVRLVDEDDKKDALVRLLNQCAAHRILIFTQRKDEADWLEKFLVSRSFAAATIHGGRSQRERERALQQFKSGQVSLLIATDVASRGLDLPEVSLVIQLTLPTHIDQYVHRIGRTGRAGKKGHAISFFTPQDGKMASDLMHLLAESKQVVPSWLVQASKAGLPRRVQQHHPHHHYQHSPYPPYPRTRGEQKEMRPSFGRPPPYAGPHHVAHGHY